MLGEVVHALIPAQQRQVSKASLVDNSEILSQYLRQVLCSPS